jgi:hypothetical protein
LIFIAPVDNDFVFKHSIRQPAERATAQQV